MPVSGADMIRLEPYENHRPASLTLSRWRVCNAQQRQLLGKCLLPLADRRPRIRVRRSRRGAGIGVDLMRWHWNNLLIVSAIQSAIGFPAFYLLALLRHQASVSIWWDILQVSMGFVLGIALASRTMKRWPVRIPKDGL